jgi:MFS family permease
MMTGDSQDLMGGDMLEANFAPKTGQELEKEFDQVENIEGKSAAYCFGLLLMLGSGGYYFGYYMGIWNPLGQKHLRLNLGVEVDFIETAQGLINVCYAVGAMFGCLFGSVLAVRIGRIRLIFLVDILSLVTVVGYMFPYLWLLYVTLVSSGFIAGV